MWSSTRAAQPGAKARALGSRWRGGDRSRSRPGEVAHRVERTFGSRRRRRTRSRRGTSRPPRRPAGGTGTRPPARSAPDSRSGSSNSTARSRYTSKNSDLICMVPMWDRGGSRRSPTGWHVRSGPGVSRRTSSRSAWSHTPRRCGETPVTVEQRGRVGDGAPAVEVVLGVDGEVHADIVTAYPRRRLAGPRAGDHEPGARGQAVAQGLVDAHIGGMTRSRGRRN